MAVLHRAAWVLPIARPPIRDGWVLVEDGKIVDVGAGPPPHLARPSSEMQSVAILPGLVNAHTHLELSWMRGQVPPSTSMPAWARQLIERRRAMGADPVAPIVDAVSEIRAAGTTLVGEVSNTLASYDALADSDLSAMVFRELIGFNPVNAKEVVAAAQAQLSELTPLAWIRTTIVPHAPYSVSEDLFREIAAASSGMPTSVHLGESRDELDFLRAGTGAWRQLLQELGAWPDGRQPPACGPVEFIERAGLLNERLLAVHCVQLDDRELSQLAEAGATVVTCPRSNRWTGAGTPPVDRFYSSGARVAIGTDSIASVEDLSMFSEMAAVRALAPSVAASAILGSATLNGANALGFGPELGSIEPGKRAELIAVAVPEAVADVEEYLVGGRVSPADIRWLDAYGHD